MSLGRSLESDPLLLNRVSKVQGVANWRHLHGRGDILTKVRRRFPEEIHATRHVHILFAIRWVAPEALGTTRTRLALADGTPARAVNQSDTT